MADASLEHPCRCCICNLVLKEVILQQKIYIYCGRSWDHGGLPEKNLPSRKLPQEKYIYIYRKMCRLYPYFSNPLPTGSTAVFLFHQKPSLWAPMAIKTKKQASENMPPKFLNRSEVLHWLPENNS